MNTDMMLATAAAIELEPEAFNLGTWLESSDETICGTIGCVAGHAALVCPETRNAALIGLDYFNHVPGVEYDDTIPFQELGAQALDLTDQEAELLFTEPFFWGYALHELELDQEDQISELVTGYWTTYMSNVSAKQAAEVLRALAHGELKFRK